MPSGPPMPRPVLPRDRGVMDKLVEFIVGDGPANRFALICRQCASHNGMALQEEFEYLGKYFEIRQVQIITCCVVKFDSEFVF
jgi:Predicted integral membrane zinc-ribbon metal-binding protein